jgi:hypothetical protein
VTSDLRRTSPLAAKLRLERLVLAAVLPEHGYNNGRSTYFSPFSRDG